MKNHLQIIGRLTGKALKSFAIALLLIDVLFGFAIASLCFLIAAEGSLLKGLLAASISTVLITSTGFIVALHISVTKVIRKAIQEAGLGEIIFDGLFEKSASFLSSDLDGVNTVPINDFEQTLKYAAQVTLGENRETGSRNHLLRWLAGKIQKIAVWATVRTILNTLPQNSDSVDFRMLRSRMGGKIDNLLLDHLQQAKNRLTSNALALASSLAILSSLGIRFLLPL